MGGPSAASGSCFTLSHQGSGMVPRNPTGLPHSAISTSQVSTWKGSFRNRFPFLSLPEAEFQQQQEEGAGG